jgi:hypothetical protein
VCWEAMARSGASHRPRANPDNGLTATAAFNVRSMRITVELRTDVGAEGNKLAAHPGQRATLSGSGWSVPVSIRAISASTSDAEDREARRLLGPGYVLYNDAEEWAAVMVTYGGQTRVASLFQPPADVARLLRRGLKETARMIDQGEE